MVRAAIATIFLGIAAPAFPAAAQDIPDVEAGISLFWTSNYEGSESSFRERVVAAGDDWAIYQTLLDDELSDVAGAEVFYVLFSGIDYRDCSGDPMPGDAERAALAALFPLQEGAVIEETSYPGNPVIRVGGAQDFFLMGETVSAHEVVMDYAENDEDNEDETLIVLSDRPYTVAVDWGDRGMDRVMLIAQSDETPDVPAQDLLGTCAALLN